MTWIGYSGGRVLSLLRLGLSGRDEVKPGIRKRLYDSSEKVRWAAVLALLNLRDGFSLEPILESVKKMGRFALVELQPFFSQLSKEGIFSLEEALNHAEPEVRGLALGIMGQLKQPDALKFLRRLLNDPVLDVRMKALAVLIEHAPSRKGAEAGGGLGLSEEFEAIFEDRLNLASWEETARILQAVGAWRMKKLIPQVEVRVTHLHPWVRYRALETLFQLDEEGRRLARQILSEHRHIIFPIFEDLDIGHDL